MCRLADLCVKAGNYVGEACAWQKIAQLYEQIGNPRRALKTRRKAAERVKAGGNVGTAVVLEAIARQHEQRGEPEQALEARQQANKSSKALLSLAHYSELVRRRERIPWIFDAVRKFWSFFAVWNKPA